MQRRVYDAINVFSAINIVEKYKNKIIYTNPNQIGVDVEASSESDYKQAELSQPL